MTQTTINPQLVGQITSLLRAWADADRRIRAMLHGWEQRGARAGLERATYIQIGQLPGACDLSISGDDEQIGRDAHHAYVGGMMNEVQP